MQPSDSADKTAYDFRSATRDDLPMLERWLKAPDSRRWWGDPRAQRVLVEEDLSNPLMRMRIVNAGGRPFAYVQDYDVSSWPQPCFAHLPPGTRAIDTFIGEMDMVGRGHGSAYLRMLAGQLIAEGAPCVAIDPDPSNHRARRAYAKAGFREEGTVQTSEGPAVLMVFRQT